MKQLFLQRISLNSAATYYYHPQTAYAQDNGTNAYADLNSTEARGQMIVGDAGTVRNLRVDLAAAPGAGKSWTITVRKDGVSQSVACTISDTDTSGQSSTDFTVAAGDKLSVMVESSGSPSNTTASVNFECQWNTAKYSMISGGFRDASGTIYGPFGFYCSANNTVYNEAYRSYAPFSFTMKALYVNVNVAPGAGNSRGVTIGTDNLTPIVTLNVSDTNTEASSTGLSHAFTAGTLYLTTLNEISGPANSNLRWSALVEADTDGYMWGGGAFDASWADSTAAPIGRGIDTGSLAGALPVYCGQTGFTFKNLYVYGDRMGATADREVTVYKNGIATSLTATVEANNSGANDTSNEVVFAEDDYGVVHIDSTNTTEEGNFTMAMYVPTASPKGLPLLYAG